MSAKSILKVIVFNCSNIPTNEKTGTYDPYVGLTLQGSNFFENFELILAVIFYFIQQKGIKKKTTHKKSELNPVWNEVNGLFIYLNI
jgi:Ca2+-dependent lipid-binding protein